MKSLGMKTAILVRTKDRPIFLKRALESILRQSDPHWEIVLINDGGNREALADSLTPFSRELDGRLSFVHLEKSLGRGTGKHLNLGLLHSESELVAIHDDDDSWHPNFLEKAKDALGKHLAVVTKSYLVKERFENNALTTISQEVYEPWQMHEISLFRLAESLTFPPIAMLFKRSVIAEIGAFDDELGPLEDWEFSLRLFSHGSIKFLEEVLANYHQRQSDNSADQNSFQRNRELYGRLDAQIRNKLLRKDLKAGKIGLGFLVNLAQSQARLFLEMQNR